MNTEPNTPASGVSDAASVIADHSRRAPCAPLSEEWIRLTIREDIDKAIARDRSREERRQEMNEERYLAEEANRLLLNLACWFLLYAIGLFTTLASAPGFYQASGILGTLCTAFYCVRTGLQLYRVNKTMRDINQ